MMSGPHPAGVGDEVPARRGFAQLHRDIWRVVGTSPAIFLVLPALLWLPFDLLIEAHVPVGASVEQEVRYYLRANGAFSAIVGSLATAIVLAALVDLGAGQSPSLGRAFRGGLASWARVVGVTTFVSLLVVVGLILLVIPGLVFMYRYALAVPAAVFERLRPGDALKASRRYSGRAGWILVGWACGGTLLYLPLLIASVLVFPTRPAWFAALSTVPWNIFLYSILPIGLALIYAEVRDGSQLRRPLALRSHDELGLPVQETSSGSVAVAWVGVLGLLSLVGANALVDEVLAPIARADAAWEREAYDEALVYYERAVRWDPHDAYAHYSVGWCQLELERFEEALASFDTALALEPDNRDFALARVRPLIRLGRPAEAREILATPSLREAMDPTELRDLDAELAQAGGAT